MTSPILFKLRDYNIVAEAVMKLYFRMAFFPLWFLKILVIVYPCGIVLDSFAERGISGF